MHSVCIFQKLEFLFKNNLKLFYITAKRYEPGQRNQREGLAKAQSANSNTTIPLSILTVGISNVARTVIGGLVA